MSARPRDPEVGPILAFDCSGAVCSACVVDDGVVLAARSAAMERGHASALLPQIEEVMREARVAFGALGMIATTLGPGSFTGLRIGLAAARGLALSTGRPVAGITTFEAIFEAANGRTGLPVAALVDSRRGSVFGQQLNAEGDMLGDAASLEPNEIAAWLPPGGVMLAGDVEPLSVARSDIVWRPLRIDAVCVARAAMRHGPAALSRRPHPLYLRPPDVSSPALPPTGPIKPLRAAAQ